MDPPGKGQHWMSKESFTHGQAKLYLSNQDSHPSTLIFNYRLILYFGKSNGEYWFYPTLFLPSRTNLSHLGHTENSRTQVLEDQKPFFLTSQLPEPQRTEERIICTRKTTNTEKEGAYQ